MKRKISIIISTFTLLGWSLALAEEDLTPKESASKHKPARKGYEIQDDAIALNNQGVKELKSRDFLKAIKSFETSLQIKPSYTRAKANLAIAHNNLALALSADKKLDEAMRHIHIAIFMDPKNITTLANGEGLIRILGKDPGSFSDRVNLGDQAHEKSDLMGEVVEYEAALKIHANSSVSQKLEKARKLLDEQNEVSPQQKTK